MFRSDRLEPVPSEQKKLKDLTGFYTRLFSVEVLSATNFTDIDAWKMLVDAGLNRVIKWKTPIGETLVASPVQMLNRVGLVSHILDNYIDENGKYNNGKFVLLTLDIHDFDAYNIKKKVGRDIEVDTDGGDYVINRIGQTVKMACSELLAHVKANNIESPFSGVESATSLNDESDRSSPEFKVTPARYGGDEIAILIEGNISEDDLLDFADYIKKVITEVAENPYQTNTGEIKSRTASVKNDQVHIIRMPDESRARDVFVRFLTNNSILEPGELLKILEDFGDEEMICTRIKTDIYPKNLVSDIDKLRWITSDNNGYNKIIEQLVEIERLENQVGLGKSNSGKVTKKALRFFEHTLFNDIFNHKMLPYVNFVESLSRGEYGTMCVFEVGYLKEINSNFNLARGDEMLVSFFQKILLSLQGVDPNSIVFSRKGGTFFVGIKDQSVSNHLKFVDSIKKSINQGLPFKYRGEEMNLPCGFSSKLFSTKTLSEFQKRKQLNGRHFDESNKIVSAKRQEAELMRCKNMCIGLVADIKGFDIVSNLLEKQIEEEQIGYSEITLNKYHFWNIFLTSDIPIDDYIKNNKTLPIRYINRCKNVRDVLLDFQEIRRYDKQSREIDKFIKTLESLITKMEEIQPDFDYSNLSPSGSEVKVENEIF
jgi:GGDEF domain-containing protein